MSLFILDDMIVDDSSVDSHETKRVKITTACDTCRRRKVKCDGESPCANCTRGAYSCTFTDASAKRPRGPPKGFVALIEDRLHTIESLLVNLVNNNRDNADLSNLAKDIKNFSDISQNQPGYADELTNEDDEILMNNLIHPNSSSTLQSNSLSFLMLEDQNLKSSTSNYVEPALPNLNVNLKPIPDEISGPLIKRYFDHFHPHFPIINRGQFLNSLNNADNQPSKLLIEVICAIGAMFPPTVKPNSEHSSQFFHERAKSLLDCFIDTPRISTIQALILLYMVEQGKPSSYRARTYYSNAIKMAQSIGLNRENGAAYQGAKDRQTKKLVWWGCFILDRLNSLNTGDPLTINDKMCTIQLPSADEFDQDDMCFQNDEGGQSSTSFAQNFTHKQQINTFIGFIRIAKITGQILEHLQTTSCVGLQASLNHHAIVEIFESLLSDWSRELPSFLNYSPSMSLPGQIASLHMLHQTSYLMLYYPYVAEYGKLRKGDKTVRMSNTFVNSMNICNTAANTITNIGVESLNNVYTCLTFPSMFYCLGKAAKIHSINITSSQRGLAINSYKNIIKTVKICQFYKQNNIMKELVQKTTSLLETILIKYQDRFSHEEIFGITPSGEIVNPDGLDLTLSSFGFNTPNTSVTPVIKISSPNQLYSIEDTNNNIKSSKKRNSSYIQNDTDGSQQQQLNVTIPMFTDSFQMQPQMIQTDTLSPNVMSWSLNFDEPSYNLTPTSSTSNQTPSISPFPSPQPQRTRSLPPNSTQNNKSNSTIKSHSLSTFSSNHLTIDNQREILTSSASSPISPNFLQLSPSPRYVDTNDNNEGQFTSDNKNNNTFVISQGNESSLMYDDNSRVSFLNSGSTTTGENTFNTIFVDTPTSSRSTPSPSSSSRMKKKIIQNDNNYLNELYAVTSNESDSESSINSMSEVTCGITPTNTPIGIEYGGLNNDYNQFETNLVPIGYY